MTKYTGDLLKPIPMTKPGVLSFADDGWREKEIQRISDIRQARIPLLFEAHGVVPGDWMALALALAQAHVPGFKLSEPSGRPKEWEPSDIADLKIAIDAVKDKRGEGLEDAIRQLKASPAWKDRIGKLSTSAVKKHYGNAEAWAVNAAIGAENYRKEVMGDE